MDITVSVSDYAAVGAMRRRPHSPDEVPFARWDVGDRNRFHTKEDEDSMEGRKGGDKAEEVGRDTRDEVTIHKTHTRDTYDAEVWGKGKEPIKGDLVV